MPSSQESPRPTSRAKRPALVLALAGLLAVPLALWWLAQRGSSGERGLSGRDPGAEASHQGQPTAPPEAVAALSAAGRTPLESEGPRVPAELEPATISGRLQIDGYAPYRGRVQLRQDGAGWERTEPIDAYGRFYVEGVPAARILLSFAVESLAERQLVLPNEYALDAPPGEIEFVDLDWKTRHVNVHVVTGEDLPLRRSSIEIVGPGYRTSVDTSDNGKSRLSLVGSGLFAFRAVLASGQTGVTELELEDGEDLDSVVIVAER